MLAMFCSEEGPQDRHEKVTYVSFFLRFYRKLQVDVSRFKHLARVKEVPLDGPATNQDSILDRRVTQKKGCSGIKGPL